MNRSRRFLLNLLAAAPTIAVGGTIGRPTSAQSNDMLDDWRSSPDSGFDDALACYSKGLRHRPNGCCDPKQYSMFLTAVRTRNLNAIEELAPSIPLADPTAGTRSSDAATMDHYNEQWFNSSTMLSDLAELYWASLCRDIPFESIRSHPTFHKATEEIERLGKNDAVNLPFESKLPGANVGGHLSQFLIKDVPLNRLSPIVQKIYCPGRSNDFLSDFTTWATCQDGAPQRVTTNYFDEPRYIFNGRALAEFVRNDFSFQSYLWAALILQSWGREALNPGLNARYTRNSAPFAETGWPQVFAFIAEASERALQDCWFWKWRVFRRLRPEELAGRRALNESDLLGAGEFKEIGLLEGLDESRKKFGTTLLSQAYPEGSPLHPSFPAAHSEIAGACVTILKAFTDPEYLVPAPVRPAEDGLGLLYSDERLQVDGELNKLAWNMSVGRIFAGVHYRSDCVAGLSLGESIALNLLAEKAEKKRKRSTLWLRRFNGHWTSVSA
jgi:hypothetical protein